MGNTQSPIPIRVPSDEELSKSSVEEWLIYSFPNKSEEAKLILDQHKITIIQEVKLSASYVFKVSCSGQQLKDIIELKPTWLKTIEKDGSVRI